MRIDNLQSDVQILKELGERLKKLRLRSKMTQAELCAASGVGKRTIQLLNLIKIMRAFNKLSQVDLLFPVYELSPMDYLTIAESKGGFDNPKRVYKTRSGSVSSDSDFIWGEDK